MKKTELHIKIRLLYLLLCLLAVLLVTGCAKAREEAYVATLECLEAFDFDSAEAYAQRLYESSPMHGTIEHMKQFKEVYDAESWSEAMEIYNSDSFLPLSGKAFAAYIDCYYHTLVEPAAVSMEQDDMVASIKSLLQFHGRFCGNPHYSPEEHVFIGNYSEYADYFPVHTEQYRQLMEQAGERALADGNTDALALLAGFQGGDTVDFQDYSWSADYAIWQRDCENMLEATPLNTCNVLVKEGNAEEAYQKLTGYCCERRIGSSYYPYCSHWAESVVAGTDLEAYTYPFEAFVEVFAEHEGQVPVSTWRSLLTETLMSAQEMEMGIARLDVVAEINQVTDDSLSLPPFAWLNELTGEQLNCVGLAPAGKVLVIVVLSDALKQYEAGSINSLAIDTAQIPFYRFQQAADLGAMAAFPPECYPQSLAGVEYTLEVLLDMCSSGEIYYRSGTKEKYDANSYLITAKAALWQHDAAGRKMLIREWDVVAGNAAEDGIVSPKALFGGYPTSECEDIIREAAGLVLQ